MVTIEKFKTEFEAAEKKGLLSKEAVDLKDDMIELLPYYSESQDVRKEMDAAINAINENIDINSKSAGKESTPEDDEAKAKARAKLKLIKIKLQLQKK